MQLEEWNVQKEARRKVFSEGIALRSQTQVRLSEGIFSKAETSDLISLVNLKAIEKFEPDTIYILNSNDVAQIGQKYMGMFLQQPRAHICIWDFDNHHAINESQKLALLSDFYVPCHPHNNEIYAGLTKAMGTPVSAAVIQWSRAFLSEHRDRLLAAARDPQPLGRHILYQQFPERNAMLRTLNAYFKHVGPATRVYHERTELDRLDEWAAHMSHWIVPTRGDLPIRVFDALITGGVPILPASLKDLPALADLQEHLFYFEPNDVEAPLAIAAAANAHFGKQGEAGIIARHELAMAKGHMDSRVQDILAQIHEHLKPAN